MRLINRLLAALVAGVVAAFSALVAVEIVLGYYFDQDPWLLSWDTWDQRSRELSWSDRSVVVTFVLIGAAGVVLLAAQLWKRPPVAFPLKDANPDVHAEINRRSLEHTLGRAASRVDGITSAHVRSRRRRVTVRAATQRRLPGELRARVTADTASELAELGLQQPPRLVVHVKSSRPPREQV